VVDLGGRTVIPGLVDSHIHVIRGGLNYNLELRWEGVRSLGEALERLRLQARRTPPPQWVRVVGGWSEFHFAERRMPTLAEINEAAPETPVFVLHLYDRALLNRAALRALGWDEKAPDFERGAVETDARGRPTGLLLAKPNALILYSTLARAPRPSEDVQANSTRHFMRELNRLGVTSAVDAGGGFQNYPDDYRVIQRLAAEDQLTLRIGYHLFAQKPGQERADYERWLAMTRPGDGDAMLRTIGAGENLVASAADFENFLEPRPELPPRMEAELEAVVRLLAAKRWPFRIHGTYDESIDRFLGVFERVHRDVPLSGLRWFLDHAETISDRNVERVRALGGGIAIQHRMAFQGEYFAARYGREAAQRTPPLRRILDAGVPLGAGTDATRVASYDPWLCLYWLVSGRTLGGAALYPEANRLERSEALRLWTEGSSWFSSEEEKKGAIAPGRYADLAVLSKDFFSVPEAEIQGIESLLTVVGGRVVHGAGAFAPLAPALPPASPDWSPARPAHGPAPSGSAAPAALRASHPCASGAVHRHGHDPGWGRAGCDCALV
jgi:predicted amidohydrolase YtcJ